MPAAHDIYNEELLALNRGDALYHPEPAVGETPVEIGDVGYTKQGAFSRLFNACRPADDPVNAQWGVPEGFEPLDMGRVQDYERELGPGPLHGETITHAALDLGASGGIVLPADVSFRFSCSSSQGAILMLETHMSRTTVQQEGRFKNYLDKHCLAWYKFAADNDILVDFGDIILVTECSRTAAWASAIYSQSARDFGLQFSVGSTFAPVQNSLGVASRYERLGSMQHRRSQRRVIAPADLEGVSNDQTVFIKGYRPGPRHLYRRSFACKVRKLISRSAVGNRDQHSKGVSHSGSGSSSSSVLSPSGPSAGSRFGRSYSLGDVDYADLVTSPSHQLPDFHPAVALLAHAMENTDTEIATVHDDEWCFTDNEETRKIIHEYAQVFFGEEFLLNDNHFAGVFYRGVSVGFFDPLISVNPPRLEVMPNVISLPYHGPPLHIQGSSWTLLLMFMAGLPGTRLEAALDAVAVHKAEVKLRTVVQFAEPFPTSSEWQTVLYFTLDHPAPRPEDTGPSVHTLPYPNSPPYPPTPLRPKSDTPVSNTYTIPASDSVPYPTLPITFPNLAVYLLAALEDSRRYLDGFSDKGKLARMMKKCYPSMEQLKAVPTSAPASEPSGAFNKSMRPNDNRSPNSQLVTPFIPDEWG